MNTASERLIERPDICPDLRTANQHEARPVAGIGIVNARQPLSGAQGARFIFSGGKFEVEMPHKLQRGAVIHLPEAGKHRRRSGVHERSAQANHFIAAAALSQ